ncbi:hypothetical protein O181_071736 [Austropuccinia psidii MF-1]|uniref:Uncharacterized protein n=1 Tax=Austropuccinia psidii MF-1 TaxID=1389203 RepID=A0A9Q3F1A2_9BASI|nr:hypothetical protein [Austropuccinia psidii MF-1]
MRTSNQTSSNRTVDFEEEDLNVEKEEALCLAEELKTKNEEIFRKRMILNAKSKLEKKRNKISENITHKQCKTNGIVSSNVRSLVQENVVEKGMYQKEASEAFNISSWQVYRILHENPREKKQYKKCEGKINDEIKTNLLYFIEKKINS